MNKDFIIKHIDIIASNDNELLSLMNMNNIEQAIAALNHKKNKIVVCTLGKEGAFIAINDKLEHIAPQLINTAAIKDVTGAGDTVIAAIAAGMASHEPLETATRLANVAAGLVVGKVGTAAVTRSELSGALQDESLDDRSVSADEGVVTEVEVLAVVAQLKAAGKRIVLTNGCFDILHPGHVSYLSEAATLGDVLIVAVNNDASVSRLKGDDRPVNNLDARMSVLAGLRSVSYVVPFSEDTPARLIEAVTPDVLVKGGDYDVSQIAGHEHVIAEGGKVIILDFVEGHSTTATIARMTTNDE